MFLTSTSFMSGYLLIRSYTEQCTLVKWGAVWAGGGGRGINDAAVYIHTAVEYYMKHFCLVVVYFSLWNIEASYGYFATSVQCKRVAK